MKLYGGHGSGIYTKLNETKVGDLIMALNEVTDRVLAIIKPDSINSRIGKSKSYAPGYEIITTYKKGRTDYTLTVSYGNDMMGRGNILQILIEGGYQRLRITQSGKTGDISGLSIAAADQIKGIIAEMGPTLAITPDMIVTMKTAGGKRKVSRRHKSSKSRKHRKTRRHHK
jgi:hypothetical protein